LRGDRILKRKKEISGKNFAPSLMLAQLPTVGFVPLPDLQIQFIQVGQGALEIGFGALQLQVKPAIADRVGANLSLL
jgi:hypothetical protein